MTQTQAEALLSQISAHGFNLSIWSYVFMTVIVLLGSYLSAYLKKRGEHYATRQDMNNILLQLKNTTRVAEQIRGEISKGVWVEQNRWNLKREFYTILLDNLNQSVDAIDEIVEIESGENPQNGKGREDALWNQIQEATNQIHKAVGPARFFLIVKRWRQLKSIIRPNMPPLRLQIGGRI